MSERTLIILKPDAVRRGLIGRIISRIEDKKLKIIGAKMKQLDEEILKEHYKEHIGKDFFSSLVNFMKQSPVLLMVVEGEQAIPIMRKLIGKTKVEDAEPGTIRGDFAIKTTENLVHASDSKESAEREIKLFFEDNEIFNYKRGEVF